MLNARPTRLLIVLVCLLASRIPLTEATVREESVDAKTKTALALDVHRDRGRALFHEHCARCHGMEAGGDGAHAIPALAGQRFDYLVRQLANFAGQERDSATMHGVLANQGLRAPQTWADIAGFLNRLPMSQPVMTGSGVKVSLGGAIFHEQCASCHRADAQGDVEGFVPSLRHEHYPYLVAQMHRIGRGDRHNVDENLARFLRSFDEVEIDAVADYLSRLEGPGERTPRMRADGTVLD
jgi:cytochrome c553